MEDKNIEPQSDPQVDGAATETEEVSASESVAAETAESPYKNGFLRRLDNFYGVTKKKSSIRVEIFAGLATFLAMCYILVVNPGQILNGTAYGVLWPSVFLATAFGALIGTLLMSLVAKMPYAQAPGMGLNSMVGTLLSGAATGGAAAAFSFGTAMLLVLISGVIFLLLTVIPGGRDKETGRLKSLREYIFDGIPKSIRSAIPVGIGLFIAYIGFQNAGVIKASPFTQLDLINFNVYVPQIIKAGVDGAGTVEMTLAAPLLCLAGLIVIAVLSRFKVKGAVIIGIVVATIIAIPTGVAQIDTLTGNGGVSWKFWENFANFFSMDASKGGSFLAAFTDVDFSGKSALYCIMTVVSFCMIDMFDTLGTVTGCATRAGLLDKNGNPLNLDKCMYADSIATCTGALLGTSTVTTFVESGAGVAEGGKTGLTALTTAVLFLLSIFLLPLFAFIPSQAAACALIYVGVLMMSNVKHIDFEQVRNAVPAFFTIIIMPLGYSITDGIGMGLLLYVVISLIEYVVAAAVAGAKKLPMPKFDIPIVTFIVAIMFAAYFFIPTSF